VAERRHRYARAACAALVGVALLGAAGCANIPTSGPVRPGDELQVDPENEGVPFIAEPPHRGAAPDEIVRGFLRAGADFRNDHAVAREYLTPAARQSWNPDGGTVVYTGIAEPQATAAPGQAQPVVVQVPEVARVDGEGSYRRSAEGSVVERAFGLERVEGQWRIARLDDGLLLSALDVTETYRQVALYFLSPTRNVLVPDVVLLPQLQGLSTQLVSRLLRGPTAALRGAVRTAFPQGTSLDVESVPVSDGLATVQLDEVALRANEDARQQMSAQLVWTLKQLGPEVTRVRITAGGEDLVTSGVPPEQPREAWATFDPDAVPGDVSLYAVRDGAVGEVLDERFAPVAGAAGSGGASLRTPAVSLDGDQVAAVSADGRVLVHGRLAEGAALSEAARGGELSRPSFDPAGNLWFADRATGGLFLLPAGAAAPVPVPVPRLPGGRLSGVAASRDGVRLALVSGTGSAARLSVVAVAGLDRLDADGSGAAELRLVGLTAPLPALRGVRDVAWTEATTVVALGSLDDLPARPHYISVDGYRMVDVEPLAGLVTITAAPPANRPLVGATTDGELVVHSPASGRGWESLLQAVDPAFPG